MKTYNAENLNPIEEAEALENLRQTHGYTQEDLAQIVGKSRPSVTNLLAINGLPKKIRKEGLTLSVSKVLLFELARVKDPKKQAAMWRAAKKGKLSVREVRQIKKGPKPGRPKQTPVQHTISQGQRFLKQMKDITDKQEVLDQEQYETLLGIYQEFLSYLEKAAEQKNAA